MQSEIEIDPEIVQWRSGHAVDNAMDSDAVPSSSALTSAHSEDAMAMSSLIDDAQRIVHSRSVPADSHSNGRFTEAPVALGPVSLPGHHGRSSPFRPVWQVKSAPSKP